MDAHVCLEFVLVPTGMGVDYLFPMRNLVEGM